jgi:hypothetical protein
MLAEAMKIELLLQQTTSAYQWTNDLLDSLPYSCWQTLPPVLETNALWQAGHLLVSFYFNSILVIRGHQSTILQTVPLKLYSQLFTQANPALAVNQVDPDQLFNHMRTMQKHSIEIIKSVKEDELYTDLLPTQIVHPVAKTKLEALDWNIKHTLWHCGQIALITRVVHKRHEFNLIVNINLVLRPNQSNFF